MNQCQINEASLEKCWQSHFGPRNISNMLTNDLVPILQSYSHNCHLYMRIHINQITSMYTHKFPDNNIILYKVNYMYLKAWDNFQQDGTYCRRNKYQPNIACSLLYMFCLHNEYYNTAGMSAIPLLCSRRLSNHLRHDITHIVLYFDAVLKKSLRNILHTILRYCVNSKNIMWPQVHTLP